MDTGKNKMNLLCKIFGHKFIDLAGNTLHDANGNYFCMRCSEIGGKSA